MAGSPVTIAAVNTVRERPTETGAGVAGALALILVYVFDVHDPAVYVALVAVLGALPAAITWLVVLYRGGAGRRDEGGY
jgi:hypothetical protein